MLYTPPGAERTSPYPPPARPLFPNEITLSECTSQELRILQIINENVGGIIGETFDAPPNPSVRSFIHSFVQSVSQSISQSINQSINQAQRPVRMQERTQFLVRGSPLPVPTCCFFGSKYAGYAPLPLPRNSGRPLHFYLSY